MLPYEKAIGKDNKPFLERIEHAFEFAKGLMLFSDFADKEYKRAIISFNLSERDLIMKELYDIINSIKELKPLKLNVNNIPVEFRTKEIFDSTQAIFDLRKRVSIDVMNFIHRLNTSNYNENKHLITRLETHLNKDLKAEIFKAKLGEPVDRKKHNVLYNADGDLVVETWVYPGLKCTLTGKVLEPCDITTTTRKELELMSKI